MTILITGATGQLGNAVLRYVLDRTDEQVIVSVRNPEKFDAAMASRSGRATSTQPETLDFHGVDKLLIVSVEAPDTDVRIQQHANAIAKAVEHGVGHVFYTSVTDADTSTVSVADVHKATEEAIRATGIPFTFLRNGMYHENYLGALSAHVVAISTKDGRIASAARDDYALAAAVVLTTDGHENADLRADRLDELVVPRGRRREVPRRQRRRPDRGGPAAVRGRLLRRHPRRRVRRGPPGPGEADRQARPAPSSELGVRLRMRVPPLAVLRVAVEHRTVGVGGAREHLVRPPRHR